uniref:Gustatory receptor n=1 Tax=Anoplophora chinensis TaxID=217632 RepID=A0A2H4ZBD3_ANOCN|nr:gustatory receptor [Anoplophora chinensis]
MFHNKKYYPSNSKLYHVYGSHIISRYFQTGPNFNRFNNYKCRILFYIFGKCLLGNSIYSKLNYISLRLLQSVS